MLSEEGQILDIEHTIFTVVRCKVYLQNYIRLDMQHKSNSIS